MSERRLLRFLPHPRPRVFRALTDPAELRAWLPLAPTAPLAPGVALAFDVPGGVPLAGEVVACEPPARLVYTLGDERVTFELSEAPGGTILTLTTEVANDAEPPAAAPQEPPQASLRRAA